MAESLQPDANLSSSGGQAAPVDRRVLEEMLGPEEAAEVLSLFLNSTESLMARLDMALVHHDTRLLRDAAHELKGAAYSVGAEILAQGASDLEQASLREDWLAIGQIQARLVDEFVDVRDFIRPE